MSKNLTTAIIAIGAVVAALLIFGVGLWIGRSAWSMPWMNAGVWNDGSAPQWGTGPGADREFNVPAGRGPLGMNGRGAGMMGGYGMQRSFGDRGGRRGPFGAVTDAQPITEAQAKEAVQKYLTELNIPDLEVGEIMIFERNAYAGVVEKSTGTGAFELLVDPQSLAVAPEPGPNRMWNLKYGASCGVSAGCPMGGGGWGMMGARGFGRGNAVRNTVQVNPDFIPSEMSVSPEKALELAQKYLDDAFPGTKTAADAEPFYGYYTIDFLKDGKPAGMLSVNGYSGQVFYHAWHGDFVEAAE